MPTKQWFLSALAAIGLSLTASAHAALLHNGQAAYLYAYPEGKATVTEKTQGSKGLLSFSLPANGAAGAGVGFESMNLSGLRSSGALEFFISGALGSTPLNVGFTMAKNPKAASLQVSVPLSNYASVSKGWVKVTIPLSDFPAQGSRWNASKAAMDTGAFNWNEVGEFTVSAEGKAAGKVQFFITGLSVAKNYSAAAVQAARAKASQVSSAVAVLTSAGPGDGVGAYAYPEGKSSANFSGGKLAVKLDESAWAGGGLNLGKNVNLASLKTRGKLIVQAAGAKGGEAFNIGFRNAKNGAGVQLNINPYLPGGLKKGTLSTISIPLADFGDAGKKWDDAAGANVDLPFDWSSVNEVIFDNNGPGNNNGLIYFGAVQIAP